MRWLAVAAAILLVNCSDSAAPPKQRGPHWSNKATLSTQSADRSVGGFNSEERRAYRTGVQHVLNQHGKIGTFTIAQIVDQQRGRDGAAQDRLQRLAQQKAKQVAREREAAAKAPAVSVYAKDVALIAKPCRYVAVIPQSGVSLP
jgi:hypothetical protein